MESSKVSALLCELKNLQTLSSKSIVFSQWTAFLDLLQIPLSRYNLFLCFGTSTFHVYGYGLQRLMNFPIAQKLQLW